MHLYDRLKSRKLIHESMHEDLNDIQTVCDILVSCEHPIEEMRHILIILNGVKDQFDNAIAVIHGSRNLYDIASVSVLLDAKVRQSDVLFD